MWQTEEESRVETPSSGGLPLTIQCECTYSKMLMLNCVFHSLFGDLNWEGESHTGAITNTTWATDGSLLKLEDGFETGID